MKSLPRGLLDPSGLLSLILGVFPFASAVSSLLCAKGGKCPCFRCICCVGKQGFSAVDIGPQALQYVKFPSNKQSIFVVARNVWPW